MIVVFVIISAFNNVILWFVWSIPESERNQTLYWITVIYYKCKCKCTTVFDKN